jgi:signal transduction histidine kinase
MKSITYKLWSGMMLLVIFVLILLWFFQIIFLEKFYVNQRVNEVKNRGLSIIQDISVISKTDLEDRLDSFIYDYNSSIDLVSSKGDIIYSNGSGRRMPMMGMPMMGHNYLKEGLFKEILSGKIITVPLTHPRFNSNYMIIGLPVKADGEITGALIINMPLAPVSDTVETLKKQLLYISIILFFSALILSFLLSRTLIKPILSITRVTEQIASGDLSVRLKIKSRDEIGILSQSINHLGEELSKIEQLRRDFIANVSHELRTPLSLIRGYAETIRDVTGDNQEKREKQLGIIIEESERLGKIVDDILDLSQMQSDNMTLNISAFDLNETIKNVVKKYELYSEQMEIQIVAQNSGILCVKGDQSRIQQVLHNLLNNAFNHSISGGTVTVMSTTGNKTVKVEVSDTGRGISPEDIGYIWERYYKANKSDKRKRIGTGLGLAIVKNILEAHKSKYGVESAEGKGTTFWFELELFQ